jgi:hypothetical protein
MTQAGRLRNIREIASLVNAGGDTGTIFERIVCAVCQHTSWNRSGIMVVDRGIGYSVLVTRFEPKAENEAELANRWALSTSPSLKVAETKQPVVIEDAQVSEEFPGYREDAIAWVSRSAHLLCYSLLISREHATQKNWTRNTCSAACMDACERLTPAQRFSRVMECCSSMFRVSQKTSKT